jgi:hypothetical protein
MCRTEQAAFEKECPIPSNYVAVDYWKDADSPLNR